MIDPTKGLGPIQSITGKKPQESPAQGRQAEDSGRSPSVPPRDEVSISQEALSLAQAQDAASSIRNSLKENRNLTLGLDPGFIDSI